MENIELGNNHYDVDFDDNESLKLALINEIIFQHRKYDIKPRGNRELNVSIHNRNTRNASSPSHSVKQFSYYPQYSLYSDYKSILCFQSDPYTSMKTLISKVIKKCEEKGIEARNRDESNRVFKKYIEDNFHDERVKTQLNEYSKYLSAEIVMDECRITINQSQNADNYSSYINVSKDSKDIVTVINKLLK